MRKVALGVVLVVLTALLIQQLVPASGEDAFVVVSDVAVPMRDGVILRADVWRPRGDGPFPVLVYRTPYDRREAPRDYTTFRRAVERGYAVVIQDVRGRYGSEGEFVAYQQEGKDGYDTIEWAARQRWSNGAVGTFGLSYPGAVQWLAAMERPPHLKAMVPAMTFSTPRNFFTSGGVADLSWIGWIWNNIAPDTRARKGLPGPKTGEEARAEWKRSADRLRGYLPLAELPELKEVTPYYAAWLLHPPEDPWWEWSELRGKYDRVEAAVLNLSGWYDETYGPEGATTNFNGLISARKGGLVRTALLMGPWVHGVDATAETSAGERSFGPAARIDYDEVVLRWMDRYLKGTDNGVDREKPVKYFVMGANTWREAYTWPPAGSKATSLYLTVGATGEKSGVLRWTKPESRDSSRAFVSDPANPLTDPYQHSYGGHDYRALAGQPDVLIYDTPPLAEDLEVTGPITAEIHLSCDAPDTDLWVRLLDVAPDGTAFNLTNPGPDVLRASYRDPARGRQLLEPGKVYTLRLTNTVMSNVFRKDHRIRVQISAAFFPHFSRNLHTGESEAVSAKMRKATIRIHHDRARPSRILLSVVGPAPR